jgi:hypothetical protein
VKSQWLHVDAAAGTGGARAWASPRHLPCALPQVRGDGRGAARAPRAVLVGDLDALQVSDLLHHPFASGRCLRRHAQPLVPALEGRGDPSGLCGEIAGEDSALLMQASRGRAYVSAC